MALRTLARFLCFSIGMLSLCPVALRVASLCKPVSTGHGKLALLAMTIAMSSYAFGLWCLAFRVLYEIPLPLALGCPVFISLWVVWLQRCKGEEDEDEEKAEVAASMR